MNKVTLICGEALEEMGKLSKNSVDLIACDLPYGTTQNKWDSVIPLEEMWKNFHRILKPTGKVILTAAQPFTSILVASNLRDFKYDLIWEKTISSNQLNVKHQPLRSHESILVFYSRKGTYNEQITSGAPYSIKRKGAEEFGGCYGGQKESEKINEGYRHARSVIKISNPRVKGGHPTEKPVELMEYIIKAYSNEGDIVIDPTMGSGTTGVACKNLKRGFIGIELEKSYFAIAHRRIKGDGR